MNSLRGCSSPLDAKPAPLPPPLPPPPPPEDIKNKVQDDPKAFHKNILNHKMNLKEDKKYDLAQEIEQQFKPIMKRENIEDASAVVVYCSFDSSFQPMLQNGPMCGIVALAMAGYLIGKSSSQSEADVNQLLDTSIEKGFSKQGEMFSCENMKSLVVSYLGDKCDVSLYSTLNEGIKGEMVRGILEGGIFLVPYDADFNHSPAKRNGHGAHWAIIHGILLFCRHSEAFDKLVGNEKNYAKIKLMQDERESGDYCCKCIYLNQGLSTMAPALFANMLDKLDDFTIYLTASQGKSSHLGIWKFDDLIDSNRNLFEISPKITKDEIQNFLTFDIKNDLCSKVIFIKKSQN